jgi:hypothetical protein
MIKIGSGLNIGWVEKGEWFSDGAGSYRHDNIILL